MKSLVLMSFILCLSAIGNAQTIDSELFKTDIVALYDAGMKSFKNSKEGEFIKEVDGVKSYNSNLSLNGAKELVIKEDAEGNYKCVAQYTMKNIRDAKAKVEEIAVLISQATADFSLDKASTTDVKYLGYTKHTIEFPADNIDDMGKHTSFSVGLIDDGNPISFEIVVTEILWK
jgi:hypothetical protein